jgi:hypothetical protein
MPKDEKVRKRMVVEEVSPESESAMEVPTEPTQEVEQKAEEVQEPTLEKEESVEKTEVSHEELPAAKENVEPPTEKPNTEFGPVKPSTGPNPLLIIIPGVLLLGALLGGVYFYQKGVNQSLSPTPTPESSTDVIEATTQPSSSPSAKLDLTKYSINVQNGSGIPGTAGAAKDILTKAGFKVGTTGNADNYDYTDTIIKAKSDVPSDFITKLTTTLSATYEVAKAQTLSDSSTDTIVVIIGSSKAE